MSRIIFSTYVCLLIVLLTLFYTPLFLLIWLLTVAFDKKLLLLHYFSNIWGSSFTVLVPGWKVEIIGKEKIKRKNTKIIVANHQSQEDILLMYRLGIPFKWVSKAEVFRIPIYGWLMYLKGDIKLQRSSKASIKKMLLDSEKVIRKGSSIAIFPEGTRSKTGNLGNFKDGAFALAKKTQTSILPVVIYGTGCEFISSNFYFKGKHNVILKIIDEIPYGEFEHLNTRDISKMVREKIEMELGNLKSA